MRYTADFETTTDENDCRVWAFAVAGVDETDFFKYGNSIDDFMRFCENSENGTVYFHNLKFDGEFILIWLFEHGFTHVVDRKEIKSKTFTTLISDKGMFYSIRIVFEKEGKRVKDVTIYDSLKILPFSVAQISKGFNLPISKLDIDYDAPRPVGHELTADEIAYIHNDVSIVAQALKVLFSQGLEKMTQGSNALFDYKRTVTNKKFEKWFPVPEYDDDVRQSYKGGFTYLNPKYREVDIGAGIVLDVNSLYPWAMHDCPLPYGEGMFFEGRYQPDKIYNLYVQMFTCQFELKDGFIPTIQLKNNLAFVPTEYLTSSEGEEITMCLTSVDLELFLKHYDVYNVVWHSGWKFKSTTGLFTEYIDKWTKVKIESTLNGNKAMRTLAKLMLNALYGKFALNPNVQSKIPIYDNGLIRYRLGEKETRKPIYIPVGTFITAWARHKTISNAQLMYDSFVYADTDSLHLRLELPEHLRELPPHEIEMLTTEQLRAEGVNLPDGFEVDPVKLGAWKLESHFYRARFLRQKSYVEDSNKPETWGTPDYNPDLLKITCAGMPAACYQYVTFENFHTGENFAGKLQPKHVKGGIVLKDIDFTIKKG